MYVSNYAETLFCKTLLCFVEYTHCLVCVAYVYVEHIHTVKPLQGVAKFADCVSADLLFDELYEAYQEHVLAFGKKLLDYKDCKKLFYNRTTQIRAKQPNGSRNRARKGYRLLTQLEQEMDYTSIEHLDSRIDTLREKNRRDKLTLQGKRLYPLVEYLLSDCSVETYKNL